MRGGRPEATGGGEEGEEVVGLSTMRVRAGVGLAGEGMGDWRVDLVGLAVREDRAKLAS